MSELLHVLEPSFDRRPQSLKATPSPVIIPSGLTTNIDNDGDDIDNHDDDNSNDNDDNIDDADEDSDGGGEDDEDQIFQGQNIFTWYLRYPYLVSTVLTASFSNDCMRLTRYCKAFTCCKYTAQKVLILLTHGFFWCSSIPNAL